MITGKVETDSRRFDLVSLGECLVELRKGEGGRYDQAYAGDVFNSLYYASRLGMRTGFISQFGEDFLTDNLLALCDKEQIDHSLSKISQNKQNGLYIINTDSKGQPSYSFWRRGSAATQTLKETPFEKLVSYMELSNNFLFSAIGLAILEDQEKLFDLLAQIRGRVRIYFDMNVRRSLWENINDLRKSVERLALHLDVIFVSSTDAEHVFGKRTAKEHIDWFSQAGYRCIVYREGERPTIGWDKQSGYCEVESIPNVDVVDATGAGDAFNAGFIFGSGQSFLNGIRFGNVCGALAVGERGALASKFSSETVLGLFGQTYNR